MSKVGKKPIDIGNVNIQVEGNVVHFKGANSSGVYELPLTIKADVADKKLLLSMAGSQELTQDNKMVLGLHRARLANTILGAEKKFEKILKIVGLGFKVVKKADKELQFSLGYSHKKEFTVPAAVDFEIDKTGQLLTMRSADKEVLGLACDKVKSLRKPEPYKGTGIQYSNETIRRKAGKAK